MRLNFQFESASNMALNGVDTTVTPEATLFATFIYLDSAERKRFSQNSHEYLITVLQVCSMPHLRMIRSVPPFHDHSLTLYLLLCAAHWPREHCSIQYIQNNELSLKFQSSMPHFVVGH